MQALNKTGIRHQTPGHLPIPDNHCQIKSQPPRGNDAYKRTTSLFIFLIVGIVILGLLSSLAYSWLYSVENHRFDFAFARIVYTLVAAVTRWRRASGAPSISGATSDTLRPAR